MDPDSALLQTVANIKVNEDTLARHAQLRQCWTDMETKGHRRPQDTRGLDYEASPQEPRAKSQTCGSSEATSSPQMAAFRGRYCTASHSSVAYYFFCGGGSSEA
jgi:hypothetical protein